jgi:membrane protease YdiL (CAAX protease family)
MKSRAVVSLFVGPQGLRAGWGILLFLAMVALVEALSLVILPRRIASGGTLFLAEAMLFAAVAGSTAAMAWVEGRSVWSYGLARRRVPSRLLWGAFWGVVLLALLVGLLLVSGQVAIESGGLTGAEALGYGIAYAGALLVVALAEEMLFRGYLQATLARLVGFWPAACLLSLAFGAIHRGNPGESVLGLVSAVLIGGVLCLCLRLSGSLWWPIGFHAGWNWAQVFLWGTPVSGFEFQGALLRSQALGDPLWSGGDTGPEGSLLILPILGLAVLVILRSFARVGRAEAA